MKNMPPPLPLLPSVMDNCAKNAGCDCGSVNKNNDGRKVNIFLIILALAQAAAFFYLHSRCIRLEDSIRESCLQGKFQQDRIDRVVSRGKRDVQNDAAFRNEVKADLFPRPEIVNINASASKTFLKNDSESDWVWLNEYTRLPYQSIEGFCKATHGFCPPAEKGEPGVRGETGPRGEIGPKGDVGDKGERGEGPVGPTGLRGPVGPRGLSGPKGSKGDKGDAGVMGLDGRDGLPGEPGLDGVPGRNGRDGIPGKDGTSGKDGIPGTPGRDGKNGSPGEKGSQGVPGSMGPTGLPGPRGKSGRPGMDGTPGIPGIVAWNCSVNGSSELLKPPSLLGSELPYRIENITVEEGRNVKLTCAATGYPNPVIMWRKVKGKSAQPIFQDGWGEINSVSNVLLFRNISRLHMGEYVCIAQNGIPPAANQTFRINVHFPPFIEITNTIVNVSIGGIAQLECKIEAYPRGVYYWENFKGDIFEQSFRRYAVDYDHIDAYVTVLQMNISFVTKDDLGIYYCIGKNDNGVTRGYLNVTDLDPSKISYAVTLYGEHRVTYGKAAPALEGVICPECLPCKICGFGYRDLEIRGVSGTTQHNLDKRRRDCQIETIGKPVYHMHMGNIGFGSWMKDSDPPRISLESASDQKMTKNFYWVTFQNNSNTLFEYDSKTSFTSNISTKIDLKYPFMGNAHVVYAGCFYYNKKDEPVIVQFNFTTKNVKTLQIPGSNISKENLLYKSRHNYFDILSDDNGLWVIYGVSGCRNTAILKINVTTFEIQHSWNISLNHQDVGDMFIMCGILYAIESVSKYNTTISLALDLYNHKLLDETPIYFTNPFKSTVMITYNHLYNELYTIDGGNMLTYPIRHYSISYDKANNDTYMQQQSVHNQTGVEIIKNH